MIIIQLVINIIFSASLIYIISQSFHLIYITCKYFNITHSISIAFGAYFTFFFIEQSFPIQIAIPLGIFTTILLALIIEQSLFRLLRKRNTHSLVLLIASLGLYIILQNIISISWGDTARFFRIGEIKAGNEIFGAHISDIQIATITISLFLLICTIFLFKKSNIGRQMSAIYSNEELACIFGINSDKVILWALGIGSSLAAITGILVALDTYFTPNMGFSLLLYGVVAMIIGGVSSTWGLVVGSFTLAIGQHLGAYFIDTKWMEAIIYIILILFLIMKPFGFSGGQLKKIDI